MISHLGLLPFLCGILLLFTLRALTGSLRKSIPYAGTFILLGIAGSTELLSFFRLINYTLVAALWSTVSLLLGIKLWRHSRITKIPTFVRFDFISIEIVVVLIVALFTSLVALGAPPNTWDGMTYHMSRIVHWINNQSINFYPTPIPRQNYMPALAEEAMMHVDLLSKGDTYVNFVAWSYFIFSIAVVSVIIEELGLPKSLQNMGAVLSSLLPMAIFQATGCKNDMELTFLCVTFVLFLLRLSRHWNIKNALIAGVVLGLGLYCKGTFLLIGGCYGLIFAILELYKIVTPVTLNKKIKYLALVVGIGALVSSPYWIRTYNDHFSGFHLESSSQNNEDKSLRGITSIALRNAAVHLSLPNGTWNKVLYSGMQHLLGESLNDRRTTTPGYNYLTYYWANEDHAGNPVHFILGILSVLILLFSFKQTSKEQRFLLISLILTVGLFVVMLKWQPWVSRLHTPFFFLSIPLVCCVLGRFYPKNNLAHFSLNYINNGLIILCGLFALPALLVNSSRPLISHTSSAIFQQTRNYAYFNNRPEIAKDYLSIDQILKQRHNSKLSVALLCGYDDWEYPLLLLSGQASDKDKVYYCIHYYESNRPESLFIGLGSIGLSLKNVTQLKPLHIGSYASLYEMK
jgi:hypothetical protein